MNFIKASIFLAVLLLAFSCQQNVSQSIDEDELGIIDADVKSEDTQLKEKAKFGDARPGSSKKFNRSFENAPPLIPHTVEGFLPIKIENNICLSCHMPERAKETGAVPLPKMHFTNLRHSPKLVDGKYRFADADTLVRENMDKLNNAYFNCSQCHVPQTKIKVNIENLFTPEFREEFGIEKSGLDKQFNDGL